MRKLEIYVRKYGDEAGPRLFYLLQSQAAHAGVSARLRKKIERLTAPAATASDLRVDMPLFDNPGWVGPEAPLPVEVVA